MKAREKWDLEVELPLHKMRMDDRITESFKFWIHNWTLLTIKT